jgi:uncharacterized membrane protein YcjF (UPF0283 family)
MLKHVALPAFLFLVLLGFEARHAFADIYKYVTEEGEISLADNLESVPEKYRATAVNMTAVEEQKLVPLQQQTQPQAQTEQPVQPATMSPPSHLAATQEAPREEPAHQMEFTTRLLMTVVVIVAWFVVLIAIKKTGEFKGREKVLQATRIALACIFLVYLVMVHGKDVVNLFTMAGSKIDAMKEKQAQRGKKAGQAIKALNKLMEEAGKQPPPKDPGEEKDNQTIVSDPEKRE